MGLAPTGKRRLVTAHPHSRRSSQLEDFAALDEGDALADQVPAAAHVANRKLKPLQRERLHLGAVLFGLARRCACSLTLARSLASGSRAVSRAPYVLVGSLLMVGWGTAASAAVTVRPYQKFGPTNCTYAGDCATVFLPVSVA